VLPDRPHGLGGAHNIEEVRGGFGIRSSGNGNLKGEKELGKGNLLRRKPKKEHSPDGRKSRPGVGGETPKEGGRGTIHWDWLKELVKLFFVLIGRMSAARGGERDSQEALDSKGTTVIKSGKGEGECEDKSLRS